MIAKWVAICFLNEISLLIHRYLISAYTKIEKVLKAKPNTYAKYV